MHGGACAPPASLSLCRDAQGVYQLATLLMELDTEDEVSRLLAADALYRLGRLDDAHKALLVALSRRPQAAPVLARLALLQLRRGFSYDANQVRGPGSAPAAGAWSGQSCPSLAPPPLAGHSPPRPQVPPLALVLLLSQEVAGAGARPPQASSTQ